MNSLKKFQFGWNVQFHFNFPWLCWNLWLTEKGESRRRVNQGEVWIKEDGESGIRVNQAGGWTRGRVNQGEVNQRGSDRNFSTYNLQGFLKVFEMSTSGIALIPLPSFKVLITRLWKTDDWVHKNRIFPDSLIKCSKHTRSLMKLLQLTSTKTPLELNVQSSLIKLSSDAIETSYNFKH